MCDVAVGFSLIILCGWHIHGWMDHQTLLLKYLNKQNN